MRVLYSNGIFIRFCAHRSLHSAGYIPWNFILGSASFRVIIQRSGPLSSIRRKKRTRLFSRATPHKGAATPIENHVECALMLFCTASRKVIADLPPGLPCTQLYLCVTFFRKSSPRLSPASRLSLLQSHATTWRTQVEHARSPSIKNFGSLARKRYLQSLATAWLLQKKNIKVKNSREYKKKTRASLRNLNINFAMYAERILSSCDTRT